MFHLFFNLTTIVFVLLVFGYFYKIVVYISYNQSLDSQIANGYLIFNIAGVLVFIPFG